jgi:hypothetical protein
VPVIGSHQAAQPAGDHFATVKEDT